MEEEVYELDSNIDSLLVNLFTSNKYRLIKDIIEVLDNLNKLGNSDVSFDLNQLESDIEDIMYEKEEEGVDSLRDYVDITIQDRLVSYLSDIGIILVADNINYTIIRDIFSSVYTIFTIEDDLIPGVLEILDSENSDVIELIAELLSEYVGSTKLDLYEAIDEVGDFLISEFKEQLNLRLFYLNKEVDDEVKELIIKLISVDSSFTNTRIVNSAIQGEYDIVPFNINRNSMYHSLELYKENEFMIPYEIVATLYMSSDTKSNLAESYSSEIDLDLISYLHNDNIKHNTMKMLVDELISKTILKG